MIIFEIENGQIINGDIKILSNGKYKLIKLDKWITQLQHGLYRGWYLPCIKKFFEEKGHYLSEEQIHNNLKDILLSKEELNEITGEINIRTKSMADMSRKECVQYLKDIFYYMLETWHYTIPDHKFIDRPF